MGTMGMTVEQFAAERGRTVEEALEACRRAGVLAWSGFTPLDDQEVRLLDAALAPPPPPSGWAPPPPPGAPASAAPGWGAPVAPGTAGPVLPPPGYGGPPPPPPSGSGALPPPPPGAAPYGTPGPIPPPGAPYGGYQPLAPRRPRFGGAGRAVAVGGAILLTIGVRVGLRTVLDGDNGPTFGSNDRSELVDLSVGQCYLDRSGTSAAFGGGVEADADPIGCDQLHDGEVYHRTFLGGGSDAAYGGDEVTFQAAAQLCLPEFAPFVGVSYEQSTLDFVVFYPSADSWEVLDDRSVTCAIVTMDGSQLLGTVAGSGR